MDLSQSHALSRFLGNFIDIDEIWSYYALLENEEPAWSVAEKNKVCLI